METLLFAGFGVAAVCAAVAGLVGGFPDPRRVKRVLARARLDKIATLAEGSVATVRGTVTALDPLLIAPLTPRRCVFWTVVFDEVGAGGDYVEIGRAEAGSSFLLADASGVARVVPDRPRLALLGTELMREVRVLDPNFRDLVGNLARTVCRPPNHPSSTLRATEYVIEDGATITVRGWCTREPLPDATDHVTGYREELPTRAVISGSRATPLMIA